MKRCSDPACKNVGSGKYCEICGKQMISDLQHQKVVNCPNIVKNGSICNATLVAGQKFCKECGSEVDQKLFAHDIVSCRQCGKVMEEKSKFCSECGYEQNKPASVNVAANVITNDCYSERTAESKVCQELATSSATNTSEKQTETGSTKQKTKHQINIQSKSVGTILKSSKNVTVKPDIRSTVTEDAQTTKNGDSPGKKKKKKKKKKQNEKEKPKANLSTDRLLNVNIVQDETVIAVPTPNVKIDKGNQENKAVQNPEYARAELLDKDKAEIKDMQVTNSDQNDNRKKEDNDKERVILANAVGMELKDKSGKRKKNKKQRTRERQREQMNLNSDDKTTSPYEETGKKDKRSDHAHLSDVKVKEDIKDIKDSENPITVLPERQEATETRTFLMSSESLTYGLEPRTRDCVFQPDESAMGSKSNENNDVENKRSLTSLLCHKTETDEYLNKNRRRVKSKLVQSDSSSRDSDSDSDSDSGGQDHIDDKISTEDSVFDDKHRNHVASKSLNDYELPNASDGKEDENIKTEETFMDSCKTQGSDVDEPLKMIDSVRNCNQPENVSDQATHLSKVTINLGQNTNNLPKEDGSSVDGFTEPEASSKNETSAIKVTDSNAKPVKNKNVAADAGDTDKKSRNHLKVTKGTLIFFHVLVSGDFKFDTSKHVLLLAIERNKEWFDSSRKRTVKRQLANHVCEIEIEVEFTEEELRSRKIHYKYCVYEKKDHNQLWEHYFETNYYSRGCRELRLPAKRGVWHQYDGFIEKLPTTWTETFLSNILSSWKNTLTNHANFYVEHFATDLIASWKTEYSMSYIIERIQMLFSCIRNTYFVDAYCWHSEEHFKGEFGSSILNALFKELPDNRAPAEEWSESRQRHISVALLAVFIAYQYGTCIEKDKDGLRKICTLLILRPEQDKRCSEFTLIEKHFQDKSSDIRDAFLAVARKIARNTRDPCWLFLTPWIHFLYNWCSPYEVLKYDVGHDKPEPLWWGLTKSLDEDVKHFKRGKGEWETSLLDVLMLLQPMFDIDHLLPRTFMTVVDLNNLGCVILLNRIPDEVSLATLVFFAKRICNTSYTPEEQMTLLLECVRAIEDVVSNIDPRANEVRYKMQCYIATQLLVESLKSRYCDLVVSSIRVTLHCLSRLISYTASKDFCQQLLTSNVWRIVDWIDRHCSRWDQYKTMETALAVWNDVYAPSTLASVEITTSWNTTITKALTGRLAKKIVDKNTMTMFVRLYCLQVEQFNSEMKGCMCDTAFKAVSKGCILNFTQFNDSERRNFGNLLSTMFVSEWNQNVKEEKTSEILQHIISWPQALRYVKIYQEDQEKVKLLSNDCIKLLDCVVDAIRRSTMALLDGNIAICDLSILQNNDVSFTQLAEIVKVQDDHTSQYLLKAIQVRHKEMSAFNQMAAMMITFTSHCKEICKFDSSPLLQTLEKQEEFGQHKVNEFCTPSDVKEVECLDTFKPLLNTFGVSHQVLAILLEFHKYSASRTFECFWIEECKENKSFSSLDDVVDNIWIPVKERLNRLANDVISGEITFGAFEGLISKGFEGLDGISIELKKLGIPDKTIKSCLIQLQNYRHIGVCVEGAKSICKIAEEFSLTGDFKQLKEIATRNVQDVKMNLFDHTLMEACKALKCITKEKADCLEAFVNCKELVHWLRESMKTSGLKELQVFVDLAFMSAGDEPINIARVQCLRSAVTGYSPLIFDLKDDYEYMDLLQLCSAVWKELDSNPELPEKLRTTCRYLSWLKEIKQAHGSVEMTSLMQAETINENGVFIVGFQACKVETLHSASNGSSPTVSDVLSLQVPDKETETQIRTYSFSQLQDLQSRLMLVAGNAEKTTNSVDRFTMILDSLTRLSSAYIKLWSSGCVLFKEFCARFYCDPKESVCISLAFGQEKDSAEVKGRKMDNEVSVEEEENDLKDMIPKLATFLEKCLEDWSQHIKEQRKNSIHLNYFTVDQIVLLQRELVKVGSDIQDDPNPLIYTLLSAIKEKCSPDDLIEAMIAAKGEIDTEMSSRTLDKTDELAIDEETRKTRQTFIDEIVKLGYAEELAVRAFEHVKTKNVKDGVQWCIANESDALFEVKDSKEKKPVFTGWSHSQIDLQTFINAKVSQLRNKTAVGSQALLSVLTELWKLFLESISSVIRDYLTLDDLGRILKYLALKSEVKIVRSLPAGLNESQPNLIMCSSAEVLMTTLSVYASNKDEPLPQPDEVLLCTPSTTIDEVDIFWRRALFDGGQKIHCLVNADMLDYDVSEAAEKCLDEYLQEVYFQKDLKFRLLVICGLDNEYKSGLVTSLDKYKRQTLPSSAKHLRDYVGEKLTLRDDLVAGIKPAACVDYDRSTVRVIKSWRAGVGKTLFKQRKEAQLSCLNRGKLKWGTISIPIHQKHIDMHYVTGRLLVHTPKPDEIVAKLVHIDIAHEVQTGVDYLLFNLLILGCLVDKTGFVWRKLPTDIYLIETMPLMVHQNQERGKQQRYLHPLLAILPDLTCRSPQESLDIYQGRKPSDYKESDQLFDDHQFHSEDFQRTFQYLQRLDKGGSFDNDKPAIVQASQEECLQTFLRHCGVRDPSWSELYHFVMFLNTQLIDFEQTNFCSKAAEEYLPGFRIFLLRFLITMSRDFSTRSLNMGEETPKLQSDFEETEEERDSLRREDNASDDLHAYQLRRTWESSPHPYLFFNSDRATFTFLGFCIDRQSGNLLKDKNTDEILAKGIMKRNLYDSLVSNKAPLNENFDSLPRAIKIMKLCNVMGIDIPHDPDETYELTTDNVKKMLAIHMRFRCGIPVIIMGETGCGKTRLIKFMCDLQVPPGVQITNMILMKVHGGTKTTDIIKKVKDAERIAQENKEKYGKHMFTVLFFDEANTTEDIGLIKEIMCDQTMEGEKLNICDNMKIVAACNPYRKHSEELIKKLEQAGLGYHVNADETTDRLGRVPMRRLVYRVQPLPQSLLPLVWDFGQLNTDVEQLYIIQMVRRYVNEGKLPDIPQLKEVVSKILTASQEYMRAQKDECSFVSLRDVDRALTVMSWFYQQSQEEGRTLFNLMDQKLGISEEKLPGEHLDSDEDDEDIFITTMPYHQVNRADVVRSLILAIGVCYHACLKTRDQYRTHVAKYFSAPIQLIGGEEQIKQEIDCCQEVFLDKDNVHLEDNIARNMALKENVFMMVVCIELRIPLFLVGKPGSSKSLAKTIVSDAMQGNAASGVLFREFKQAQMVSFQCSPLSTPDGIVGTFRQCAQFQKDKDLDSFVSIVVLDEVGLAEDSPRMPLKTLHPLLEDGCQGDEEFEQYKKVAFIGISNWALDPAKMNRGILVQREVPNLEELIYSAKGICHTKAGLDLFMDPLIKPMALSYLQIFENASKNMREFYGLRDFYSLVKMVYSFVRKSNQKPTWLQMLHAIKRNFGGFDSRYAKERIKGNPLKESVSHDPNVNPEEIFKAHLKGLIHFDAKPTSNDPEVNPVSLIHACLFDRNIESRYLLLLTENYGVLAIIQQEVLSGDRKDFRPITIFGSSFRNDQEYTQVCRNINKIKVCMETGKTVVLLNLENLYESLYDALNQYYVYFGGERYVDLGLGTHRVKCPVHKNFSLIVVAEKETVYKKFPIPLINRLEKHFLTINTLLTPEQQQVVQDLKEWATNFVTQKEAVCILRDSIKEKDVFIGYHDDTCSAIVLHVWEDFRNETIYKKQKVLQAAKLVLLWCATPESLVRLEKCGLPEQEVEEYKRIYFKEQAHESLVQYLKQIISSQSNQDSFVQITTHSKLMAGVHKREIEKATAISIENILLIECISSFDTEQQFTNKLRQHFKANMENGPSLMVIQCESGDVNANLIACARYCIRDEFQKAKDELKSAVHVVFIIQLPRGGTFTGFQCGVWRSVHIDDLYTENMNMPSIQEMQGKSVAGLFSNAVIESVKVATDQGLAVEHLSMKGLVLNSVHAALSMVKNKNENTARETERITLARKLLLEEDEGELSFLRGVCGLLAKLLNEKELSTNVTTLASQWMINEAASNESISKAGTFRRSCLQIIEAKVSPILAGIIAYLDTNDNLSILDDTQQPWKQKLWLTFLNNTNALNFQFSDLQSPISGSDLQQVVVMSTGCNGHIFRAMMPFSWLLINKICELIKLNQPKAKSRDKEGTLAIGDISEDVIRAVRELKDPVGNVISKISDENETNEAVKAYIHDLVHTMYHASSKEEYQLVVQSVYSASPATKCEIPETHLLHRLVLVHLAYEQLIRRLSCFRDINSIWMECSISIQEMKEKQPDNFVIKQKDYTFTALYLLIENLTPKREIMDSEEGRIQWMNKCQTYRPVVEKVISLQEENPQLYDDSSFRLVKMAKNTWSRVIVVKLFLENFSSSGAESKLGMSLWTMLEGEVDLKKSLDDIESFLKTCNTKAIKEYFGSEKCCKCGNVFERSPVTLPCMDVVCDKCYSTLKTSQADECTKCHKELPDKWEPLNQTANKYKLECYHKRCKMFFMEVVSQLCFANNTPPSQELVKKLIDYIFYATADKQMHTKDLIMFRTGIDPNPVFRSFLLQLIIRTAEGSLKENLEIYLNQARQCINTKEIDNAHQLVDLCLFVVQCLEDKFIQDVNAVEVDEIQYATNALLRAKSDIVSNELTVEKLYALASARMGLAVAAKCIADITVKESSTKYGKMELIGAAKALFQDTNLKWIRSYTLKYLCRCYGMHIYWTCCIRQEAFLSWINSADSGQVVQVSDRFVVCGSIYATVREAVTKAVIEENIDYLAKLIQEMSSSDVMFEPALQLAFYREVTCSYLYPRQQTKLSTQLLQDMEQFIETSSSIKNKLLLRTLISNRLVPQHLVVHEGLDLLHQGIQSLVLHFLSVISLLKIDEILLQPLLEIIQNSDSCVNMFLPTMPQDDLEDFRDAMLAARKKTTDDVQFFRCRNGHPYAVTECGRPWTVGKCQCGEDIGGKLHILMETNTPFSWEDLNVPGHTLGSVDDRGQGPKSERDMNPACCSSIRLIVHMAMFLGTGNNIEGIKNMIKPDIDADQVEDFLWAHIHLDVEDLHRAIGRSVDDALLLMHTVVEGIVKKCQDGTIKRSLNTYLETQKDAETLKTEISQLSTKKARRVWEKEFSKIFLEQLLKDLDFQLEENNRLLAQDSRLGASTLLSMLYETDTGVDTEDPSMLQEIPRVWRYRTPISLAHLRQEAMSRIPHNQHKVLQLFLQEEHILRGLRYIPSILRLHLALLQKYQRKLDRWEASQIKLLQMKTEKVAGEDTAKLLNDFTEAWELVRHFLKKYLCPTEYGGMKVSDEYCNCSVNEETPVIMLLPTTKEAGLCSYALLDFLFRKQNDFLDKFSRETQRIQPTVSVVQPRAVTAAHLITYDAQHDILPLILANCQYSFELGKGTQIEYDFAGMEKQLMDKFLFSKSRIDVGSILQIDQMVYRTELTNAEVLMKLKHKIPQEPLSDIVKTQICSEFKLLPDLCQSINNLDIAIGFLTSLGGEPQTRLHEFMLKTLQMNTSISSQTAQQNCEFRHTQSLWLLMSLQKSIKMTESRHHTEIIFESLSGEYHENLSEKLQADFREYALRKLSIDKLSHLVDVMHEYIILVVAVRQNSEQENFIETKDKRLSDYLRGHLERMDNPTLDVAIFDDFPKEILNKHCAHAWVWAYNLLREKQTGIQQE